MGYPAHDGPAVRPLPALVQPEDQPEDGERFLGVPATTLAQRRALARALAAPYQRASKREKTRILDQVCAATGWHRSHARKALLLAGRPTPAESPRGRPGKYGADVVAALRLCWTILDRPAGKRLAPVLPELVPVLRRHQELVIDDRTADLLMGMSAATIDRRLAPHRRRPAGATRMRPGSLLRNELPLRTWTEWDHDRPGFMELTLTRHDGGTATGDCLWTVSTTDIATGWTENRTVSALPLLPHALDEIARVLPFPVLGLDCGTNGATTDELVLGWCEQRKVTFAHARPAGNGTHHVGQKNWSMLHDITGGLRYGPGDEPLLNRIWSSLSRLTNYFYPQQRSTSVDETDGRRQKEYETATPYRRLQRHSRIGAEDKAILADTYTRLNPAELYRRIGMLTHRLHARAAGGAASARALPLHFAIAAGQGRCPERTRLGGPSGLVTRTAASR